MRRLRAAILAALLLALGAAPSAAFTAIAYSPVDEYYGWGAGFGSASRAAAEAVDGCQGAGGKECQAVIGCPDGYGAVAYADDSATGVAMICGITSTYMARAMALTLCVAASNALCWTSSTFDEDGDDLPDSSNEAFDLTYYSQEILSWLGFLSGDVDGENGPRTREAVKAFQTAIGWEADGELDYELFWVLMDFAGGPQATARSYAQTAEEMKAALPDVTFATAAAPFPQITFSEEIARRDDSWRRQALAAQLVRQGQLCTIPAEMAEAIPPDGTGGWHVRCFEDDYTIVLGQSVMVASGFAEIRSDATGVTLIPLDTPGSEPATEPDPQPGRGGTGRKLGH